MSPITLIFGSTTGNTEAVAHMIAAAWGEQCVLVRNIAQCRRQDFEAAEVLILGIPTWENGSLQRDWARFISQFETLNLHGKKVALFGLGDAHGFATHFVHALRVLHDKALERGADIVGYWSTAGYDFIESSAVMGDHFAGLVIDQENASEKSVERIAGWVAQLKRELGGEREDTSGDLGSMCPPNTAPD